MLRTRRADVLRRRPLYTTPLAYKPVHIGRIIAKRRRGQCDKNKKKTPSPNCNCSPPLITSPICAKLCAGRRRAGVMTREQTRATPGIVLKTVYRIIEIKLKQNWNKTIYRRSAKMKQFFVSVLFSFYFSCADSYTNITNIRQRLKQSWKHFQNIS